eukprot:4213240-Pyramimonas_sp.AAC.1
MRHCGVVPHLQFVTAANVSSIHDEPASRTRAWNLETVPQRPAIVRPGNRLANFNADKTPLGARGNTGGRAEGRKGGAAEGERTRELENERTRDREIETDRERDRERGRETRDERTRERKITTQTKQTTNNQTTN